MGGIQWIGTARICEVYIQDHGRTKFSYIGTVRCSSTQREISVKDTTYPYFYGQTSFDQIHDADAIRIRFLSIKGKSSVILNGLCLVGDVTNTPVHVKETPINPNTPSLAEIVAYYQQQQQQQQQQYYSFIQSN